MAISFQSWSGQDFEDFHKYIWLYLRSYTGKEVKDGIWGLYFHSYPPPPPDEDVGAWFCWGLKCQLSAIQWPAALTLVGFFCMSGKLNASHSSRWCPSCFPSCQVAAARQALPSCRRRCLQGRLAVQFFSCSSDHLITGWIFFPCSCFHYAGVLVWGNQLNFPLAGSGIQRQFSQGVLHGIRAGNVSFAVPWRLDCSGSNIGPGVTATPRAEVCKANPVNPACCKEGHPTHKPPFQRQPLLNCTETA